ncbi:MAG: valine--tRNA ligase [Clostridiales bacterium]|jgi:valyl-tRNA synthetase|nr:valine--tRNA ligase [Clostridiales bacterium]
MARIDSISKAFDPNEAESRLYEKWTSSGYFKPKAGKTGKKFSIVMPPPNITGQLHMGHALDNTLQDTLTRYKRMSGYETLWVPGTDHASIATEARIVATMREEGLTKDDLGRDKFLERAWAWKEQYGGRIVEQLKKIGSSCDWSHERFTMDEGCSDAVKEVFVKYYNQGLIYRGERIINWCPHCLTSISNAEVDYADQAGHFWHLRYPFEDGSGYIDLATTRPETLLGDTAVAVNPKDERYKDVVGKMLVLPLVGRKIPVIADDYVDIEFGTGAVKITPAHDPNDFEVGQRHGLEVITVLTEDAKITEDYPKYAGMDRYEAREAIVKDLEEGGFLTEIEDYSHNVGTCYRCGTTIEPRVSLQWFVKMEELAKPAIEAVRNGSIRFVPERFSKNYFNWMEDIRDWCISRQLWWGHRIPAFYCDDCGELVVTKESSCTCPKCGKEMRQDPDTLDTWFSSALWPFSTLGWPEKTEDLAKFYPTDTLVTGYDIITFWVSRMIVAGLAHMDDVPFRDILIHGLVRDSQGRKMSKSLGNGIDPLEVIEQNGCDALRFALVTGNAPGNDQRFQEDKILMGRNLSNKIWNAMRFVVMNTDDDFTPDLVDESIFTTEDKWILTELHNLITEATVNLDNYEFGVALSKIVDFLWDNFCDWYIEITKSRLYDKECKTRNNAIYLLNYVLSEAMKLLHPFMPFITEEVYSNLIIADKAESIMVADWPEADKVMSSPEDAEMMNTMIDAIRGIRAVRKNMDVAPSRKAHIIVVTSSDKIAKMFTDGEGFLERLASVSSLETRQSKEGIPSTAVTAVFGGGEIYIPLEDLIDIAKELERLDKEKTRLDGEIKRLNGKLSNESFVSKAPAAVVEQERAKLAKYEEMYANLSDRIEVLSK